jgi:hypothetical protein
MTIDAATDSPADSSADSPTDLPAAPRFRPRAWEPLATPQDVELWIAEHNQSMQENISLTETGCGICFDLTEGGQVFLQTGADGAVILELTAEAEWVAPLIAAAAQVEASHTALWILPDDKLIQLVLGLSSLIATSMLVVGHRFGSRRSKAPVKRRY